LNDDFGGCRVALTPCTAALAMASQVYGELGPNIKGQPIAQADAVPPESEVMVVTDVGAMAGIKILRVAPKQPVTALRFDVWMALAKSAPLPRDDTDPQMAL